MEAMMTDPRKDVRTHIEDHSNSELFECCVETFKSLTDIAMSIHDRGDSATAQAITHGVMFLSAHTAALGKNMGIPQAIHMSKGPTADAFYSMFQEIWNQNDRNGGRDGH
jgi:hypothetical protein